MTMNFWLLATAIPLAAAVSIGWPLLSDRSTLRGTGITLLILIPVSALFLYQGIGSPQSVGMAPRVANTPAPPQENIEDLLVQLEQRLRTDPDDLEGWLMLGRSYKTMQSYEQAETALRKAAGLAPEHPLVLVELAEALLFSSGRPEITDEIRGMLERAVAADPGIEKGLWLLGFAAAQSGDDAQAIAFWQRLLQQMEPASGAASALQEQISQARVRLGIEPGADWPGIRIQVSVDDPDFAVPPGAVLYIIARDSQAPSPPLGARRIERPVFPARIQLSDGDSMMPQRPISGVPQIELLARLSLSGGPIASAEDFESEPVLASRDSEAAVDLQISVSTSN